MLLVVFLMTASGPASADDVSPPANDAGRSVTGTILTVSHLTGEMLIYQDGGSVIALYGLRRPGLQDIGAGDRVTVTFGNDLEVVQIRKTAVTAVGYD